MDRWGEEAIAERDAEIERLRAALQDIDGCLKDDTWSDENNWNFIRKTVCAALGQPAASDAETDKR